MNIALLCKLNEVTAGIATYLQGRGHSVSRTDDRVSSVDLANYDIGISYNYRHILIQKQIDAVKLGIINFHSGSSKQRGANPNVWAILQGSAGCLCHYIDSGIDTGPVISEKKVEVDWIDTGETLYKKLGKELENLFYEMWPVIEACGEKGFRVPAREQQSDNWYPEIGFGVQIFGTHKVKDLDDLDVLTFEDWRTVDKLRARTFPPYKGCYANTPKGKVYVRVLMEYGE